MKYKTWTKSAFYVKALKTMSIFCGPTCSKKKLDHVWQVAFYNL